MTVNWHNEPMAGLDFETTGVDVENDRIIQASLVALDKKLVLPNTQLINPGVDIPEGAMAVHGITNEKVRAEGGDPAKVLDHFAEELAAAQDIGWPIVGMNISFDLTMLDRELRRYQLRTLPQRLGRAIGPVVDVRVLDKWCQTKRRGGRKLTDLCAHYGVTHVGAHDAEADVLAACRVAWWMVHWGRTKPDSFFAQLPAIRDCNNNAEVRTIIATYRRLATTPLPDLHRVQVEQKKVQDADLAAYFRSIKKPYEGLDGHWPMVPVVAAVQQAIAS